MLTGDSFFHLSAFGEALPGLNLCGAGRVVCLIDPVGDVYACPFAIHDKFLAGNVRDAGGFAGVWRDVGAVPELRAAADRRRLRLVRAYDSCRGGCMAAKFFTGLPLDGPDPECVQGYGELALAERPGERAQAARSTTPAPRSRVPPGRAPVARPVERAPGAVRREPVLAERGVADGERLVRDRRRGAARAREAAAQVGLQRAASPARSRA